MKPHVSIIVPRNTIGIPLSLDQVTYIDCPRINNSNEEDTIIGYIHICQLGQWKRSMSMLLSSIKLSGLYDQTKAIRIGIVNDAGKLIEDEILNDPKFNIIYLGKSLEYERPTLLHMRKYSMLDPENTKYYYLHTKGLRSFGKISEQPVIDWINLMLYWNIEKWQTALDKLKIYDTYGCNDIGYHYSGNFWWAKKQHIMKLPTMIPSNYVAPEDWVQIIRTNKISIYNSPYNGIRHYTNIFPRNNYTADIFYDNIGPSPTRHCLILYVMHKVTENVTYFIKNGVFDDERYKFLFIVNDKDLQIDLPSYVDVIYRNNIGYDFGAWSDGILSSDNSNKYDNYVFINSTVIGPFLDEDYLKPWPEIFLEKLSSTVKLVGTTINSTDYFSVDPKKASHIQSMTFAVNRITLNFLIYHKIFADKIDKDKITLIQEHEVRMSRLILDAGYDIYGLMRYYQKINFRNLTKDFKYLANINRTSAELRDVVSHPTEIVFVKTNMMDQLNDNNWVFEWLDYQ